MKKAMYFLIILAVISASGLFLLRGDVNKDFFLMDTVISVSINNTSGNKTMNLIEEELKRLDYEYSVNGQGVLASYNNGGNANEELSLILKECEEIKDMTSGCFDAQIYALTKLWGFTREEYSVPSQGEIELALNGLKRKEIDLGAYLKGYGADRIKEILKEQKISSAMVSLGGTVLLYGDKDRGVLIASPDKDGYAATITAKNCVISTSGTYERYFEKDGEKYGHIINPKTGYPVRSGLKSVTVINEKGTLSDSFSTALFVMGEEGARELYKKGVISDFILITEDNRFIMTEGLEDKVNNIDKKYKIEVIK